MALYFRQDEPAIQSYPLKTSQANAGTAPGYIGITYVNVTMPMARMYGLPCNDGALITAIAPHSPAAEAGLREGDIIISLDGQPVGQCCPLIQNLLNRRAGERVIVTVRRHDQVLTIPLTLAAHGN